MAGFTKERGYFALKESNPKRPDKDYGRGRRRKAARRK